MPVRDIPIWKLLFGIQNEMGPISGWLSIERVDFSELFTKS
jgi:hypothetical protein